MFEHFSNAELADVDGLLFQTVIAPGQTVVSQGKTGRQAFIVLSGMAEVRVDGMVVATAGPGDLIGEMALLDQCPRSASVTAVTTLEVLVIDPRQFDVLLSDPRTSRWIATMLARRLRDLEQPDRGFSRQLANVG